MRTDKVVFPCGLDLEREGPKQGFVTVANPFPGMCEVCPDRQSHERWQVSCVGTAYVSKLPKGMEVQEDV